MRKNLFLFLILNELLSYRDLFETEPPLAVVSLYLLSGIGSVIYLSIGFSPASLWTELVFLRWDLATSAFYSKLTALLVLTSWVFLLAAFLLTTSTEASFMRLLRLEVESSIALDCLLILVMRSSVTPLLKVFAFLL